MLIFWPTSRFRSVDFPTFGRPTIAIEPVRCEASDIATPLLCVEEGPGEERLIRTPRALLPVPRCAVSVLRQRNELRAKESRTPPERRACAPARSFRGESIAGARYRAWR